MTNFHTYFFLSCLFFFFLLCCLLNVHKVTKSNQTRKSTVPKVVKKNCGLELLSQWIICFWHVKLVKLRFEELFYV